MTTFHPPAMKHEAKGGEMEGSVLLPHCVFQSLLLSVYSVSVL